MQLSRFKNSVNIRRAFLWSTVFGSFPFSFEGNRSKINLKCILWFSLSRSILGIQAVDISIRVIQRLDFNLDHINIQFAVVFITNVFSFFFLFSHRKRIDCLLDRYEKANSYFLTLPSIKTYCLLDILMFSISFLPIVFTSEFGVFHIGCQSFLYWTEYTFIHPFIRILSDLGTKIRTLRCMSIKVYKSGVDTEKNLMKMAKLFHLLCSICQEVNDVYSFHLLVLITIILVNSVINMYYCLTYVILSNSDDTKSMFIQMVVLLVYYNILCLTITTVCKDTTQKVKDFNILMYQLAIRDNTNRLINSRKLRIHIAMKRQVVFTAYGFFNVDYTLVHSMLAAATTYLIILIQISEDGTPAGSSVATQVPFSMITPS